MSDPARTATGIFRIAGIYGLIVLLPLFFAETWVGTRFPPAITHPEYYYGFLGAAATMQLVYLAIAADPLRYRPLMPIAALAKLNFVLAVAILFVQGRLDAGALTLPAIDLVLGLAFAWAWWRLRHAP